MNRIRLIARIDVKNENVIKGIHLEGLRKLGDPNTFAKKYYDQGIDEILFMDAVASYYDRNNLSKIIEAACKDIYVPITVGGGIRKIEDINEALKSGADKVAINTQAIKTPYFIKEASEVFGSQCIVASLELKKISNNKWEAYFDNGREPSGKDAIEWAKELESLGAGEIMVTSIDAEGTKKGFDVDLISLISKNINLPIIACGGAGKEEHISKMIHETNVDAVAIASVLHYGIEKISEIKSKLYQKGIEVRQ